MLVNLTLNKPESWKSRGDPTPQVKRGALNTCRANGEGQSCICVLLIAVTLLRTCGGEAKKRSELGTQPHSSHCSRATPGNGGHYLTGAAHPSEKLMSCSHATPNNANVQSFSYFITLDVNFLYREETAGERISKKFLSPFTFVLLEAKNPPKNQEFYYCQKWK